MDVKHLPTDLHILFSDILQVRQIIGAQNMRGEKQVPSRYRYMIHPDTGSRYKPKIFDLALCIAASRIRVCYLNLFYPTRGVFFFFSAFRRESDFAGVGSQADPDLNFFLMYRYCTYQEYRY
jgi:hypothetical protein